ncbi:MAG TPA: hemerythrin domain-containing protein [Jatrophihabitans sp.]|jgi:hemerythrin-like domain-containing protein|uniref:hemerythrin domain-containing protein n=1 Tax=Jatrophihabitans sp. TaxID=1932789 RepID=UPI002DFACE15|nr:hemerythrin domain-containing protein [Jatrophihabitans sp.]
MCEYCGCQERDVIAELTAEHDRLRDLARSLNAAVNAADLAAAGRLAEQMHAVLGPHTEVEESALFPALAADFADQLAQLVAEHRDIDAVLCELASGQPQTGWRLRTQLALAHLFDHILKEQDGVFPAALATLTTADWDTLSAARDRAHRATRTRPSAALSPA